MTRKRSTVNLIFRGIFLLPPFTIVLLFKICELICEKVLQFWSIYQDSVCYLFPFRDNK